MKSGEYKALSPEAKRNFSMACLRRASRTNSGGNSFQALQSVVDLMEIEIQPQSSLAGPLEIDIQIGSCAKLILNSSSDEIQGSQIYMPFVIVDIFNVYHYFTVRILRRGCDRIECENTNIDRLFTHEEPGG